MGRLEGKVAIVTGGAEGIGRATAELFAAEGARLVVADINQTLGERVAAAIAGRGGEGFFFKLDVTSEEEWRALMAATIERYDKLNVLVNNAGVSAIADIESTTMDIWNRIMAVNATGVFLGTKSAIMTMKTNNEPCSIINRSSIDGQVAEPELFAYCASKGAVTILTKSAALSCAARGYNIRVNSVHPAYVWTSMTEKEAAGYGVTPEQYWARMKPFHPLGRFGEPIDVAYLDLFLASDESRWITGAEFTIDGGATAQ